MDIYLDNYFCNNVIKALHRGTILNKEEFSSALKFYDLLDCESINLHNIPVSKQDLRRMIIDGCDFTKLNQLSVSFDDIKSPFTVVFTDEQQSKQLRKETNIAAYSFKELIKNKDVFFDYKTSHVKDDIQSWGKLANRLLKFRYMIICDNYLFENDDNNILDLLEGFYANQNKKRRFEILINTSTKQFYNRINFDIKAYVENKFNLISKHLKDRIGLENFTLSIMLFDKYHDRHIYTNLQILESTNSFSLYFNCDAKLHEFSMLSINNKDITLKKYLPDLLKLKKAYNNKNTLIFSSERFTLFDFIT